MIKPNINIEECASQIWDVIIVGSGPAGGLAPPRFFEEKSSPPKVFLSV